MRFCKMGIIAVGLAVVIQSVLQLAKANTAVLPAVAPSNLHFLTEHSPPGQFLTAEGEVAGATVELLKVVANNLQQDVQFSLLSWARAYEIALQGNNTVLFETARIPQREDRFKWVGPIKLFDMRLYGTERVSQSKLELNSLHRTYRACGYRGAAHVSYLTALGFEEGKNLTLTSRAGDCLQMISKGRTDIVALNYYRYGDQRSEGNVVIYAMNPLYFSELFLAFSPFVSDSVVASWQQELFNSFRDGTMRKTYKPHYPATMIDRLEAYARLVNP
ncbi:polar amino acid transport system substrate-binding protein [Arsukibacterium tuosuense]|uniref:Polar amino acid transport system substrate-binding protein n=1 Tax=Arsukibacterium tuosuense TaxID=1323745 RepID=A0A285JE95_9GAMM|nr:transporter substrate-binding domain-containing protein [Arsukibacterium tuosuense]SNY57481.1 polar amino acid transport system substrate-binding protein [Arsukibacterium tuosuense]